jgi:hypothetical protein
VPAEVPQIELDVTFTYVFGNDDARTTLSSFQVRRSS